MSAANGASPATRQLVDYLSDGEDEEEMEGEQTSSERPDMEETAADEDDVKTEDAPATADLQEADSGAGAGAVETPDSQVDGPSETASPAREAATEASRVSPPPRLSEKRRREEDDDDELGKMMQNKRRNSKSVANNGTTQNLLKRKGSFTGGNGGAGKIAISISSAGLRSNEES